MAFEKSKILEAAQQYTARGQIHKAIEEWKKLLTDTPNDANIYNTIGDLCLKYQAADGGRDDAISNYVKAAEIFESSGFALKGIAVYKKILKIDPARKDIYIRLGDLNCERGLIGNAREDYLYAAKLYSQEGLVREALGVYRKIADLDPSNLSVRTKIAEIFLKEGMNKEAVEEYGKVAVAHIKAGRRDEAENLYRHILGVEPNNIDAIVAVGKFRLEHGYLEEAIGYGKKALELSPESGETFSLLIESYNRAKMYDGAEELVFHMIDAHPAQLSYREMLASILLNKGDTQRAAGEYLTISREYLHQHDYDKAYMYAERATNISPDLIAAHEILFDIYSDSGKKEGAVDKGLFLAKYFYDSGDTDKAKEYYQNILKEDPYSIEAKEGLENIVHVKIPEIEATVKAVEPVDITSRLTTADVYLKYGLMEKAVAELQAGIKIDPYNEDVHTRLKDIYKTTGEKEMAFEECLALLRIHEPSGDRRKIEALIQEAMDINPHDRRIKEYSDRLLLPEGVDLSEMLDEARFYAQQGMVDEAVNVYEKVITIEPCNEEALSQLAAFKDRMPVAIPPTSFFDLGEVLKEGVTEEPRREAPHMEEPLVKSFEELFEEFQEGIKSQLSSEDYETHYNLGIAYKEMGLYQEAIEEFKLCIPETARFIDASYMMALCHKEIGESLQAADVLEKAIATPQYNDHRHLVVKYELGMILEMAGRKEEALRVFSQVHDTDATYRDVAEKVLSLQKGV